MGRFKPKSLLDVRDKSQIADFKQMVLNGPVTFVLIYADWCGHCHRYMPKFKSLAKTPGRTANMAAVNDTILNDIPEIANAKITGYPSVVKINSSGKMEKYTIPGSPATNVLPEMNDTTVMKQLITAPLNSGSPGYQGPLMGNIHFLEKNAEEKRAFQSGGNETAANFKAANVAIANKVANAAAKPTSGGALESVFSAFASAFTKVGPAALLMAAHEMLPKSWKGGRNRTYKSPKRASHRSSTRKNRRKN
jgi:thiol-disulfide isomerase/thioredoxin